jgi:hypothetical protein
MYSVGTEEGVEPFTLLLRSGHWYTGRYALAVLPWNAIADPSDLLSVARRAIRQRIVTVPFFLQVGLYLVVVGPKTAWWPIVSATMADQTSLHSVIIQGVHFLDLETKASIVNRSQWGPVRFGGSTAVSQAVAAALT